MANIHASYQFLESAALTPLFDCFAHISLGSNLIASIAKNLVSPEQRVAP